MLSLGQAKQAAKKRKRSGPKPQAEANNGDGTFKKPAAKKTKRNKPTAVPIASPASDKPSENTSFPTTPNQNTTQPSSNATSALDPEYEKLQRERMQLQEELRRLAEDEDEDENLQIDDDGVSDSENPSRASPTAAIESSEEPDDNQK